MKKYNFTNVNKCLAIDACSCQNMFVSPTFINMSLGDRFNYCIPGFTEYELLKKKIKTPTLQIKNRKSLINRIIDGPQIKKAHLTLDDLQELSELRVAKPNLGLGELSCIAYSKNKPLAVLTDDKRARNFAKHNMGDNKAFETAEILANMVYTHCITDGEFSDIINEHMSAGCNMDSTYKDAQQQALYTSCFEHKF